MDRNIIIVVMWHCWWVVIMRVTWYDFYMSQGTTYFFFFFEIWKENVKMLVAQLCLTLCNPMDCSAPGSSIHRILQARILEWVAIPFSVTSSQLRDQSQVSCIAGRFFTVWAIREALVRTIAKGTLNIKWSQLLLYGLAGEAWKECFIVPQIYWHRKFLVLTGSRNLSNVRVPCGAQAENKRLQCFQEMAEGPTWAEEVRQGWQRIWGCCGTPHLSPGSSGNCEWLPWGAVQ